MKEVPCELDFIKETLMSSPVRLFFFLFSPSILNSIFPPSLLSGIPLLQKLQNFASANLGRKISNSHIHSSHYFRFSLMNVEKNILHPSLLAECSCCSGRSCPVSGTVCAYVCMCAPQVICLLYANIGIFDVQRLSDDKEPRDVINKATIFKRDLMRLLLCC